MSYNGNGNSWPTLSETDSMTENNALNHPKRLYSKQRNNFDHDRNRDYNRTISIDDLVPTRRRRKPKASTTTPSDTPTIEEAPAPPPPVTTPPVVAEEVPPPEPQTTRRHQTPRFMMDDVLPSRRSRKISRKSVETKDEGIKKWVQYAQNLQDSQDTQASQDTQDFQEGLSSSKWAPPNNKWSRQNVGEAWNVTDAAVEPSSSTSSGTMASKWAPRPLETVELKSSWSQYGVTEDPRWEQIKDPDEPKTEETKGDWLKVTDDWTQNTTKNGWNNQTETSSTKDDDEAKSPWRHFREDTNEEQENPPPTDIPPPVPSNADTSNDWRKKAEAAFNRYSNNNNVIKRHNKERGGASSRWQKIAAQNESSSSSGYQHLDDRNKYGKREMFAPFMDPADMEKGIQDGHLYRGILRVAKNRQDSYVVSDDLDYDIYVGGMIDRNRALSGDLVVVELLDVDKVWEARKERRIKYQEDRKRMENGKDEDTETEVKEVPTSLDEEEEDDEEAEGKPKFCGRVVGILSRPENTTYAGTISIDRVPSNKPKEDRPKELRLAWFKPNDKKVPFIALTNSDIPRDLVDNEEYYKTRLFSVKILYWRIHDLNPTGRIVGELGPIGDLFAEKTAILADNSIIDSDFSPLALQCLPETPWTIPESEYAKRRDLRSARVFSIDPITAKDLDDALHVQELSDGLLEVGVHIADVSYFLKKNTVLDTEARERGTSTYLVDSVIPMLPSLLCEELCSLNPGVERLAFSVIWKMDKKGNIKDTWFGRTIIKSCAKLAYEDAQCIIDGQQVRSDLKVYNDEDIYYIYSDIRRLFKLSKEMRKRRYNNGCLSMNSVKLNFDLDDEGLPVSVSKFEAKEANRLIEEFMLCANICVAQKICQAFPGEALLRRHQEPIERRLEAFIKITDVLGLNFNGNSAGELQDSFNNLKNETVKDIMLVLAIRCMQKAKYFCSGALDISKFKHYALSEEIYTHFTSPIRRYADVVVHRLLEAALEYEKDPKKEKGRTDAAKNAQDENILLYLAKYLVQMEEKSGPVYKKATVIVVGKQFYDIHLPEYGLEKRVHMDGLPVDKFNFDKNTLALDIYWKRGVPVTMHNEEKIYAQQRERADDYSDEEEEEEKQVEDSLAALSLQEPKEYNVKVNEDDLIPPVILDQSTCMQTIKMFSVIDVRIQVNMERSPPIINLYPVNPFSGEQE